MKTEGLTLSEAAKVLDEGRCEGIVYKDSAVIYHGKNGSQMSIGRSLKDFHLPNWQLVNPVIPTDDVEVVRYMVVRNNDGGCQGTFGEKDGADIVARQITGRVVELRGIDKRPVVEPEVVEWETHATSVIGGAMICHVLPDSFADKTVIVRLKGE
jgi:hypothetical protein